MKTFFDKILNLFFGTWLRTIAFIFVIYFVLLRIFFIPTASMEDTYKTHSAVVATLFDYGISVPHIPFIEVPIIPSSVVKNGHLLDFGARPDRGDILIFRNPIDPSIYYIKRVFAVGGDEVQFSCNGIYLKRPDDKDFVLDPYKKVFSGIKYGETNTTMLHLNEYKYQEELSKIAKDKNSSIAKNSKLDKKMPICKNVFTWKVEKDTFFMVGDNRDDSFDSRYFGAVPYKYLIGKVRWQLF